MEKFGVWLEAVRPVQVVGFRLTSGNDFNRTVTKFADAVAIAKERGKHHLGTNMYAVFQDKTARPLNPGAMWHLNSNGRPINDWNVDNTGRGKTNQAYRARNDGQFMTFAMIREIASEVGPNNMPYNQGEMPDGFWDAVTRGIDSAVAAEDLMPLVVTVDYLQENFGQHQQTELPINMLKNLLAKAGVKF